MMSEISKGVSVIICTYNGAQRLPDTLIHLSKQKVAGIPWEIVLVDNASNDRTQESAKQQWDTMGSPVPFRLFSHPIPGKTGALQLGFEKALYDYLLVCDDDNWLPSNYVQLVYEIMNEHPEIGALGGKGSPAFERVPPQWFAMADSAYATGMQHAANGALEKDWEVLWGAGMVLNRKALDKLNSSGFRYLLTTKRGKTIVSGEDDEVCYALKLIDYKIWYDSRLELKHFIPEYRLQEGYLKRLMYGSATAILACEPYQRILAYKQNSKVAPKFFSRFGSLVLLIKFLIRENVKFLARYFHSDPWFKVHYRSNLYVMWLRIKHTSLMNRNLIKIRNWFDSTASSNEKNAQQIT
jgi:glycosyltransferase involved in cell wall biosynthesis